jgi:hypothetical protein
LCNACNGIHLALLPTGNLCQHISLVLPASRIMSSYYLCEAAAAGLTHKCWVG